MTLKLSSAKFTKDLQSNLHDLYKRYGSKFTISHDKKTIAVKMHTLKLPNGTKFYNICYADSGRTTPLMPVSIDFSDPIYYDTRDTAYISNIQKTNEFSGSWLVNFCIAFCSKLGVKKVYLSDGATITCAEDKYDLSYLKLLETGKTFYMKFGFEMEPTARFMYSAYNTKAEIIKARESVLKAIRKITIKEVINEYISILELLPKIFLNSNGLQIYLADVNFVNFDNIYLKENPKSTIDELYQECSTMIQILNNHKSDVLLYKVMACVFKNDCAQYKNLEKYIINNGRYSITYGKKTIKRDWIRQFQLLVALRFNGFYSMDL